MPHSKLDLLKQEQARLHRRMQRIIGLQSRLQIRLVTARTMYERNSRTIWEIENGYRLKSSLADFDENDAERATAALIAFNPTSRKNRRK